MYFIILDALFLYLFVFVILDEIENEVGKLRRIFGTEFISDKSNTEEVS